MVNANLPSANAQPNEGGFTVDKKKMKNTISLILAAIALAMGIAVVVLTTINADFSPNDIIRMLGIASAALGILALNKIPN